MTPSPACDTPPPTRPDEATASRAAEQSLAQLRAVVSGMADGPALAVLTLRDVTDQRRAEAELRASETLFRGAFEDTNAAMVLTDLAHRFVRVNAPFAGLFGYSPEEMLGMSMPDITHPDDL